MAIIKQKNKKTGITYVYQSESYWDKEKHQPRSHRVCIGKIDEATGRIVPTGGKKNKDAEQTLNESLLEKEEMIRALKRENAMLKKRINELIKHIDLAVQPYRATDTDRF